MTTLTRQMAEAMDSAAHEYEVGKLQEIRKNLRGHKRLAGQGIFNEATIFDEEQYAYHYGGRSEMQFNIGLDQFADATPAFRVGVAFSLEPSQSLPDWQVLVPRIERFNEYLREHPERFFDLRMWHWSLNGRSLDYAPRPIPPDVVQERTFIFLGDRQPVDQLDVPAALRLFDRLLDLYCYVQTGEVSLPPAHIAASDKLDLNSGVDQKLTGYVVATVVEKVLNVQLRHNELQNRLKALLDSQGYQTKLEMKLGLRGIDLIVKGDEFLWFYEIKTASTVRQCIREALGQLLEYAFWPGATRPSKLVIVGNAKPTTDSVSYVANLNAMIPIPLEYQYLALD